MSFSAAEPALEEATNTYRSIWREDGQRIVRALEQAFRISLPYEAINVVVFEGVSRSGAPGKPMYLRASYAAEVKQATLVHELAHRYMIEVAPAPGCFRDVHEALSVVLAEVWGDLWGSAFVKEQAEVESRRSERYHHAWVRALGMTQAARQHEIERVVVTCRRPTMRSTGPAGRQFE